MTAQNLKISEIEVNKGQIEGLPKNPRFIKDERFKALVKSIQDAPEMLNLRELLVYPHNGKYVVIGGNMRLRACKELGYKEVPCKILDASTDVAKLREYTIKDNNAFGSTDWDLIANEWECSELEDWGMEIPDVEFRGEEEEKEIVEDEAPAVDEVEPVCKKGDIWQLGRHRLMCGDSLNVEDICLLLNKDKIDTVFTDPPYDMDFSKEKLQIPIEDGHIFIMLDDKNMVEYLRKSEFNFSRFVVADFGFASPRGNDIYCRHILVSHETIGDYCKPINVHDGLTDVVKMEYRVRLKDDKTGHKHQKSIKFISDFFLHYGTKKCLDLFGGSGSTLIACEQLNRTCYMMELDPKYCDVIIARWEKLTNKKATKIN